LAGWTTNWHSANFALNWSQRGIKPSKLLLSVAALTLACIVLPLVLGRIELARGDAARTAQSAISAERLPHLDVAADYGLSGLTPSTSIGTRSIGVQVSIPILDGFRREGRAAEQGVVARESEVRAHDLRQQIAADVEGALLDLASAEAQQVIAAERLRLAADELAQARERFAAGVAGNIEVIDAQASLLRARDTDIDARFAAATARVALARAAGLARTLH